MYLFIFLIFIVSCKTQHVVQVERDTITKYMEKFTNENVYETIKIYNVKTDTLSSKPQKSLVKIIERHFMKSSEDKKTEQNVQKKNITTTKGKGKSAHEKTKWYDYLLYIAILIAGYFLYYVINNYRKRGYNW